MAVEVDLLVDPVLGLIERQAHESLTFRSVYDFLCWNDNAFVWQTVSRTKMVVHPSDKLLDEFYRSKGVV